MKFEFLKSTLLYVLANECEPRQGKVFENEIRAASDFFIIHIHFFLMGF